MRVNGTTIRRNLVGAVLACLFLLNTLAAAGATLGAAGETPDLFYASYIGGSLDDEAAAVRVNASGYIFVAGTTSSPDFPVTGDAAQGTLAGGKDAFVAVLSPNGSELVYSTFLGGSGDDSLTSLEMAGDGTVLVSGRTTSPDFPMVGHSVSSTLSGSSDAFVAAVNVTSLVYSTYIGGSGDEGDTYIAVDENNTVYLAGTTGSPDFPVTPGAENSTLGGTKDAFFSVLDLQEASPLEYSTYLGGSGDDEAFAIGFDPDSNAILVAGSTESSDFPTSAGAYRVTPPSPGELDGFLTRFSSGDFRVENSTYVGGNGVDFLTGIAFGEGGTLYFSGMTSSTDLETTDNAFNSTLSGSYDVVVGQMAYGLSNCTYLTYIGGENQDFSGGGILFEFGAIFIAGYTKSPDWPTSGANKSALGGTKDAYLAQLVVNSTNTTLEYSTYFGGADYDECHSITSDASGRVFLAGRTRSDDVNTTENAFNGTKTGDSSTLDVFIAGFAFDTNGPAGGGGRAWHLSTPWMIGIVAGVVAVVSSAGIGVARRRHHGRATKTSPHVKRKNEGAPLSPVSQLATHASGGGAGQEPLAAYCTRCDLVREAEQIKGDRKALARHPGRGARLGDLKARVAAVKGGLARVRDALRPIYALKEGIARAVNDLETLRDHRRLLDKASFQSSLEALAGKFRKLWADLRALEEEMVDFFTHLNTSEEFSPERRARYSRDLRRLSREVRSMFPRGSKFRGGSVETVAVQGGTENLIDPLIKRFFKVRRITPHHCEDYYDELPRKRRENTTYKPIQKLFKGRSGKIVDRIVIYYNADMIENKRPNILLVEAKSKKLKIDDIVKKFGDTIGKLHGIFHTFDRDVDPIYQLVAVITIRTNFDRGYRVNNRTGYLETQQGSVVIMENQPVRVFDSNHVENWGNYLRGASQ
ncbi:MAG: SBBP repeat-containing protein [Promethearchaeota archaeon]